MKNTTCLVLAALSLAACSRTQKAEKTVSAQLRTHKEARDTLRHTPGAPAKPVEVTPHRDNALLAQHDLSALLLPDPGNPQPVMNGFYGPDHYRIEMHFADVARDTARPHIYLVRGKSRYKKTVTPFTGEITFDSVASFRDPNISESEWKEMEVKAIYAARGRFVLREDSAAGGSGTFAGTVAIDFSVQHDESTRLWYFSETDNARGAGFLFDGAWTSHRTGKQKPVVWAKDLFMIGNDILEQFSIGERDVQINPKYRKLGWDNFWENDEWWNPPAAASI